MWKTGLHRLRPDEAVPSRSKCASWPGGIRRPVGLETPCHLGQEGPCGRGAAGPGPCPSLAGTESKPNTRNAGPASLFRGRGLGARGPGHSPMGSGKCYRAQGGRVRTPRVAPRPRASPVADPARAPHARDGKGPPLPGPAAPRWALPPDSVFGNMADAEATPPPRLGSPGARGPASRAPSTARAASVAPLEVCWRPPGSGLPAPTPLGVPVPPCLPPQALRRAATHPGEGPCSK